MVFDTSNIQLSYADKKRGLILPEEPSEELAEFMGVVVGDAYMGLYDKYFSIMEIAGDSKLDEEYLLNYVSPMVYSLFHLAPKVVIRKDQQTMYLRIMSKGFLQYLALVGFKYGKKEQIEIPKWVVQNENYLFAFTQGLADTDFSLSLIDRKQKKYKYYPRVSLKLKSKPVVKSLEKWLRIKGFPLTTSYDVLTKDKRGYKPSIAHYLHINGRKNLKRWMDFISFRNKRHLDKYEKYKKMGMRGFEPRIQDKTPKVDLFT